MEKIAKSHGLILVDTKYEFGTDENRKLILIDEIHTPDSSRFWQIDSYAERFVAGEEPKYFDKEFLRLWFKENCDPYKDATLPEAPKELVEESRVVIFRCMNRLLEINLFLEKRQSSRALSAI